MRTSHGFFGTVAGLLATTAAQAQTIWTVDDNGGADFVHIQDAVDAAQDGDVIDVFAGAYAAFVVDGKELVVRATPPGVHVAGPVVVRNVPVDRQVELDGLSIGSTYLAAADEPALLLEDNPGTVRVVDCTVFGLDEWCDYYRQCGQPGFPPCDAGAHLGLHVDTCANAVFLRCSFTGGDAESDYCESSHWVGATAVTSTAASVSFFECTTAGGGGGAEAHSVCLSGGPGGDGAELLASSTFFADRSTFGGGLGGSGGCALFCGGAGCAPPGPNGTGAALDGTSGGSFKSSTFQGSPPATGPALQEVRIAPYCFGTYEECPCGNAGIGVAGCDNSFGTGGVQLTAVGEPSVTNDTVTLVATGFNPNASPTGLFFQGTLRANGGIGIPLNDGLLCTTGTIVRLRGKAANGGAMSFGFGNPADIAVSVRGELPASGGTRFYQVWYRNQAAMFCTLERFNMSNGVEIDWAP